MVNSKEFLMAADIIKKLKTKPTDEELLVLYGYYKQATVGDNNNESPGMFDFKGKEKHKAWLNNRGMESHDAEVQYITKVNQLITQYGINQ